MTHSKNYEYQKRWRALNREKYKLLNKKCCLKQSRWRQVIQEFMRIDTTLFLLESLGVSYKTNNIYFAEN